MEEKGATHIPEIKKQIAALFDAPAVIDLRKRQLAVCYWMQAGDGRIFYTLVQIQAFRSTSEGSQYAVSSRSFRPYFDDLSGFSHCKDFTSGPVKSFPPTMIRALPVDLIKQLDLENE